MVLKRNNDELRRHQWHNVSRVIFTTLCHLFANSVFANAHFFFWFKKK